MIDYAAQESPWGDLPQGFSFSVALVGGLVLVGGVVALDLRVAKSDNTNLDFADDPTACHSLGTSRLP